MVDTTARRRQLCRPIPGRAAAGLVASAGFTLTPNGSVPLQATDPTGNFCSIYAIPGYQPSSQQFDTVADVIERELGPSIVGGAEVAARQGWMSNTSAGHIRPGLRLANVPLRPDLLTDSIIQGQLWLEVPVQTKTVPDVVLATARQLSIKIRDVTGNVYE